LSGIAAPGRTMPAFSALSSARTIRTRSQGKIGEVILPCCGTIWIWTRSHLPPPHADVGTAAVLNLRAQISDAASQAAAKARSS
jgi:hypothetical protein